MNQFLIGTNFDIVALVRADSDAHATERVDDALQSRGLEGLSSSQSHLRIQCFASDLSRAELGLQDGVYREVASKTAIVIHVCEISFHPSSCFEDEFLYVSQRGLLISWRAWRAL